MQFTQSVRFFDWLNCKVVIPISALNVLLFLLFQHLFAWQNDFVDEQAPKFAGNRLPSFLFFLFLLRTFQNPFDSLTLLLNVLCFTCAEVL
jgi:hypothetical protein